jgi:hypothetical protein
LETGSKAAEHMAVLRVRHAAPRLREPARHGAQVIDGKGKLNYAMAGVQAVHTPFAGKFSCVFGLQKRQEKYENDNEKWRKFLPKYAIFVAFMRQGSGRSGPSRFRPK